jgi:hypothetical protein
VARSEQTLGYRDLAGDDTLTGQRSSRGERLVLEDKPFYRDSASCVRGIPRSRPLADNPAAITSWPWANAPQYGLAAYIWTSNLKRGHRIAHAVASGMVWINSHNVRDLRTPFGGVKASGLGHEGGYRSIDFYTDQQAVHITLGSVHTPKFGSIEAAAANEG